MLTKYQAVLTYLAYFSEFCLAEYYIGALLDAAYIAGVTLRAQSERSLCTELAVLKKMRLRAPCHTFTPETLTDQIQINIVKKCHV